jgi:hypothetical protein
MGASALFPIVIISSPLDAGLRGLALLAALSVINLSRVLASPLILESDQEKISLLELYTSEGCSCCPPAESWLSGLKQTPFLWKRVVPVSFHVDYWNSLGWPDRYSSPEYTTRQRAYVDLWQSQSIYTPEFVLNGREWHPDESSLSAEAIPVGRLHGSIDDAHKITISFVPSGRASSEIKEPLIAEVALLGMGIQSNVARGENAGHTLQHDFVALFLVEAELAPAASGEYRGTLTLPPQSAPHADLGIALWVRSRNNPTPIQAVGGWLK